MSKKHTLSPAEYAALQAWIHSDKANRQKPDLDRTTKRPTATKADGGGMDGLTVFLLALIGMMAAWGILS